MHASPSRSPAHMASSSDPGGPFGWLRTASARFMHRLQHPQAFHGASQRSTATQAHAAPPRRLPLAFSASGRQKSAAAAAASSAIGRQGDAGSIGRHSHLIVLVNGLFGSPENWTVVCDQLRLRLDMQETLLHPSNVNTRTSTYDGIDVCGQRLADEVRGVVAAHPDLQRISFVTHSMGGLLARYALGVMYNPVTKRVCGLEPCHFVSLATPHMGCDAEGVAQVPFIGWTGDVPLLGNSLLKLVTAIATPTASALFKRTGRQFFLADGRQESNSENDLPQSSHPLASLMSFGSLVTGAIGAAASTASLVAVSSPAMPVRSISRAASSSSPVSNAGVTAAGTTSSGTAAANTSTSSSAPAADAPSSSAAIPAAAINPEPQPPPAYNPPLLVAMTQDVPERGQYFHSALSAFKTRTAYANMDGDHLVGWANSSLRALGALPPLPPETLAKAKGVVRADDLASAFYEAEWQLLGRGVQGLGSGGSGRAAGVDNDGANIRGDAGGRVSGEWQPLGSGKSRNVSDSSNADSSLGADSSSGGGISDGVGMSDSWGLAGPVAGARQERQLVARVAQGQQRRQQPHVQQEQEHVDHLASLRTGTSPQGGSPKGASPKGAPVKGGSPKGATFAPLGSSPRALGRTSSNSSLSSLSSSSGAWRRASSDAASAEADLQQGLSGSGTAPAKAPEQARAAARASQQLERASMGAAATSNSNSSNSRSADGGGFSDDGFSGGGGAVPSRAAEVAGMLHRLQELPWRRIDVSFKGAAFGFAHNNSDSALDELGGSGCGEALG